MLPLVLRLEKGDGEAAGRRRGEKRPVDAARGIG
jgi:hypothetical protein